MAAKIGTNNFRIAEQKKSFPIAIYKHKPNKFISSNTSPQTSWKLCFQCLINIYQNYY